MAGTAAAASEAGATVTVLQRSTIVPAATGCGERITREPMYLSSLDMGFRHIHYNLRVLFYEQITPGDASVFVATLRKGLEEALVHFYPLAGRLAKDSTHSYRLVIDCNDEGVEFVEAQTDASFDDLRRCNFEFQPYFSQLAQLGHLSRSDLLDVPLLSVQVTQFIGGGVAVAISHNHVVMDGAALWHFWISWSECARGIPLSRPPIHDRTCLKPDKVSSNIAKLIPFEVKPLKGGKQEGVSIEKVIYFNSETIAKLKEMGIEARAKKEGPKRGVSSLEAFFAHCWRRVTEARRLADDQDLNFILLADWRRPRPGKVSPIPENYFGNGITWNNVVATPGELRSESFAATLARVADGVDECTSVDTLNGIVHWMELHDCRPDASLCWFEGVNMNVASSPRFAIHLVDFGWGPPTRARPIRVGGDGEICLFPNPSGGLDVCIRLDAPSMQRLLQDPLFLSPS